MIAFDRNDEKNHGWKNVSNAQNSNCKCDWSFKKNHTCYIHYIYYIHTLQCACVLWNRTLNSKHCHGNLQRFLWFSYKISRVLNDAVKCWQTFFWNFCAKIETKFYWCMTGFTSLIGKKAVQLEPSEQYTYCHYYLRTCSDS